MTQVLSEWTYPRYWKSLYWKLSRGIDANVKYDGHRVHEFEVSNNMVSGDDSAKKGTQLSIIEESCIIKES